MAEIFRTIERSIDAQAATLGTPTGNERSQLMSKLNFLTHSAYLSQIQQQRHYYYGYDRNAYRRPQNTRDREYHVTGMRDMILVFELTRTEFPELFDVKDELAKFETAEQGR